MLIRQMILRRAAFPNHSGSIRNTDYTGTHTSMHRPSVGYLLMKMPCNTPKDKPKYTRFVKPQVCPHCGK